MLAKLDMVELEKLLVYWRRHFHQRPEVSYQEAETAHFIAAELRSRGIEVQTFSEHYGLCAIIRGKLPGPIIVFRADMDALPVTEIPESVYKSQNIGVMHACGHDAHMAIALGLAACFSANREELAGVVKIIFQPAEEAAPNGGAVLMIKNGLLDNAKAIFGLHVWPDLPCGTIGIKQGSLMAASDRFSVELLGRSAHAGQPYKGVDAINMTADVLQGINHIVSRELDPLETATISIGSIKAGERYNIVAAKAVLEGTVRTLNEIIRQEIPQKLERVLQGIANAYGGDYKLDYHFGYPVLKNWAEPVDIVMAAAAKIIGADKVCRTVKPALTAEDFSNYLMDLPGAFLWLGCRKVSDNKAYGLHNSAFDIDEKSLLIGLQIMYETGLQALEHYNYKQ